MEVLEMPVTIHDVQTTVIRLFRVGPTKAENRLSICHIPKGTFAQIPQGAGGANMAFIQLNDDKFLTVISNREAIKLEEKNDRLFATLPASEEPREFSVSIMKAGLKDDIKNATPPDGPT